MHYRCLYANKFTAAIGNTANSLDIREKSIYDLPEKIHT